MRKGFIRTGIVFMFLAVSLGAFAAHTLAEVLTSEGKDTFETGVRYQFYHGLALIAVGILRHFRKNRSMEYSGWFFIVGIIFFSGSLYLLALNKPMSLNVNWLGPITPIGGLLFLLGWITLFISTYQPNEQK